MSGFCQIRGTREPLEVCVPVWEMTLAGGGEGGKFKGGPTRGSNFENHSKCRLSLSKILLLRLLLIGFLGH